VVVIHLSKIISSKRNGYWYGVLSTVQLLPCPINLDRNKDTYACLQ
jgi:hypothetical protein